MYHFLTENDGLFFIFTPFVLTISESFSVYFNKENPTIADNSLLWHKNFPYLLLCLTAFASVPLILWTYVSGSEIKPEVELFGEFLEAVVKFVLKAVSKTKREEDVSHYFKRENEKITMQFSQMAKFMKHKSNSTKLIQGLFLYRLLNAVSLIGTAWIVYLIGVKNDQSTFTGWFFCRCRALKIHVENYRFFE